MLNYTEPLTSSARREIISNFDNYLDTTYDWEHISTGKQSPGLSFDSYYPLFEKTHYGRYYAVICKSWLDDINDDPVELKVGTGNDLVQILINAPPEVSDIIVSANPQTGTALETNFTFSCTGGISANPPLLYYLGYRTGDFDIKTIIDEREFAKKCTWLVIKCNYS